MKLVQTKTKIIVLIKCKNYNNIMNSTCFKPHLHRNVRNKVLSIP